MSTSDQPWPQPDDDYDEAVIRNIKQFGWHVVLIPEEDDLPAFAYTIGLQKSYGHPEVIVFGMSLENMHLMLNNVGILARDGHRQYDKNPSSEVIEGYEVAFRTVDQQHYREYLGTGMWFYQGFNFATLQMIWPDREGRFPWDDGFHAANLPRQPPLYL
ncbi:MULTISPECIES: DUF4262 domain-containing protein [Deinococcus]|uniref:DUF4262 domain-containing protein n=1 Tax=Deinococcus rufus TaxID=2136097 RepID=A0ABV7Z5E4_9DEIO|nr:DUF4262 domain-containing protein [Deinococcus sp. AB2017081]WQE95221.1 DUF4262 domain-containing protein [Deinococcus sp. AB2017081]